MSNQTSYFSHDSNAKDDPKCMVMIDQLGLEGYGIYWVLIETLREQPEYKYPLQLLPILAKRYNTSAEKMKTVVMSYNLFQVNEDQFFLSPSLILRMEKMKAIKQKLSDGGKAGMQNRWKNSQFALENE